MQNLIWVRNLMMPVNNLETNYKIILAKNLVTNLNDFPELGRKYYGNVWKPRNSQTRCQNVARHLLYPIFRVRFVNICPRERPILASVNGVFSNLYTNIMTDWEVNQLSQLLKENGGWKPFLPLFRNMLPSYGNFKVSRYLKDFCVRGGGGGGRKGRQ